MADRTSRQEADWLSIASYSRKHGVSRGIVYKWLKANLLDTYQVGNLLRIRNQPPRDPKVFTRVHE
jgi:hypothetical protein